jgi:hypothetical protein
MDTWNSTTRAYVAGFFDAEGCIKHSNGWPQAAIAQTDYRPIQMIADHLSISLYFTKPNVKKNTKPIYTVSVSGTKLHQLMYEILPYLRNKRKQAELVLDGGPSNLRLSRPNIRLLQDLNKIGLEGAPFSLPEQATASRISVSWSQEDSAYYAGFFDGEGCVTYRRPDSASPIIYITVTQVNPDILLSISTTFGVRVCQHNNLTRPRQRRFCSVQLFGDKAYVFLTLLRPYLLVKSEQADIFLNSYDSRDTFCLRDAVEELRMLNAKGLIQKAA